MNKFLIALVMVFGLSTAAMADTVGLNYSMTQYNGTETVTKGTYELTGSHDILDNVALTGKGILSNDHRTTGWGTGLEVGAKVKLFPAVVQSAWNPWVQPALTYSSKESGANNLGYVIDYGVDLAYAGFKITPAGSYADSFQSADNAKQYTAGVTVAYPVTKDWEVSGRVRHEWNETGLDSNRFYGGVAYKF